MKIGILTYHRPCNFGANLQAFASSQYLSSLGHQVKVIDFVRERDLNYSKTVPEIQCRAHRFFVETRLSLTAMAKTDIDLQNIVRQEQFDLIIVGADAVWSATDDYPVFFCKWLFDCPELVSRIRVASMSPADMGGGYRRFSNSIKNDIKNCLEQFSYVTVRDLWTQKAVNNEIFGGQPFVNSITPDPVSIIDRFVQNETWNSNGLLPKQYVLMTLTTDWIKSKHLGPRRLAWFKSFKKIVNNAGYMLVELPLPEGSSGLDFDKTIPLPFDCIQWYLTIKNAKAYCGIRFHAIVSCIAAGVPFYSLDTYCKRPKWTMLLDLIGLHSIARTFDEKSKIQNLLRGTGFESFRTGGNIEFESPANVGDKIFNCNTDLIKVLSARNQKNFVENIHKMLNE